MGFGIYSCIDGAKARNLEMEVLANNIANVSTVGFKEMGMAFHSEMDKAIAADSDEMPKVSMKSKDTTNFTDGAVFKTDNPLDLALQGDGFFEVQTQNGPRYTRNGHFTVNKDGSVITQQGDLVLGTNGNITLPPGATLTVSTKGEITAGDDDLGKIRVVTFDDKSKLSLEGSNYFKADGLTPRDSTSYAVNQGFLESANVSIIRNLTRIVEVSRAYESMQKSMSTHAEITSKLNNVAKSM